MQAKKKRIVILSVITLIIALTVIFNPFKSKDESSINATVKRGAFEVSVVTSGELEAKNSVNIMGPGGIRGVGIWQVKISDLIAEGSVVKKGDYIATLDKTEIMNKIKDEESELSKIHSKYIQTKLDTTLDLRQARDEISNMSFTVKEKKIVVEQSTYEPPATIRQANLDLEKTNRSMDQQNENYKLKVNQAKAKMQEVTASLNQAEYKLELMKTLLKDFNIIAPEDGMLIYHRDWNGKKKVVGSTISAWEPTVATLPDLFTMLSKTYVNEVDIRKVKVDQMVKVSLDAYPEKKMTGKVISVANVGEQNPKTDAKVFEVNILINEKDTTLRPAMTTGNHIIAEQLEDVLFIPLESIFNQGDSLTFVYKKEGLGFVKNEIKIAQTNENFAVVEKGVLENDVVSLAPPSDADKLKIIRLKE
ncbi:MAG: efflux RND transporter periplasmic adaptor subunit [Bacteroidota bacterium]|nr:efflux RND transporter periplasmic adaptor subunit [Bacteroidota bacterium]